MKFAGLDMRRQRQQPDQLGRMLAAHLPGVANCSGQSDRGVAKHRSASESTQADAESQQAHLRGSGPCCSDALLGDDPRRCKRLGGLPQSALEASSPRLAGSGGQSLRRENPDAAPGRGHREELGLHRASLGREVGKRCRGDSARGNLARPEGCCEDLGFGVLLGWNSADRMGRQPRGFATRPPMLGGCFGCLGAFSIRYR